MSDDAFIRAILASPEDPTPRLIYADWLEERGDPRGEYLRLLCALDGRPEADPQAAELRKRLRALEGGIDPRWCALFFIDVRIERIKSDDFLRTPFPHTDACNPFEDEEDAEDEEDGGEQFSQYEAAGTLVLCHEGCGILHLLVVTGPSRGQMWVDDRCNDQGLFPLGVGFLDWYERWLDSTLAGGDGVWWHGGLE